MRKSRDAPHSVVLLLEHFWSKFDAKIHQKTITPKHGIRCQGCQNGIKIDAKSHHKSMRKLVTKKSGKSSKIMFFWMVRSLEVIVRTNVFDGLEGCMCERWRYQKNIKNETKVHPKIDEKSIQFSCSKNGYPKDETSSTKWSKKEVTNAKKLEKTKQAIRI